MSRHGTTPERLEVGQKEPCQTYRIIPMTR
jgi:hypothetical protein